MSIELESKGVFCPQYGSKMKQFGRNSRKQYRCREDFEHYATDDKIKTFRKVVLK